MLDLPRFAVLWHDAEIDCWQTLAMRLTYAEALVAFDRHKADGLSPIYLVGLAFVRASSDGAKE